MKKFLSCVYGNFGKSRQAKLETAGVHRAMFTQTLRIMKLTVILLLAAFLQVSAKAYSQHVTLDENNVQLDKVINEIRRQTGFGFLYNSKLLKNTKLVTIKVKDEPLQQVLSKILVDQPLTYSIVDQTIVLKKREVQYWTQASSLSSISLGQSIGSLSSAALDLPPLPEAEERAVVKGVVTDTKGEPLVGVSVRVKGANVGTSTDINGAYTINAADNSVLVFTYIGYTTREVALEGKITINVTLTEDAKKLSEVVVTAFGVTKQKRGLGYAVQEVRGEEFTEARMNNVASALTGKIAGVDATQVNSGPGGSSRVIIRGNTSLNGNQQPLYVVDGMPINNVNRGPITSSTGLNVDRGDGISSMNPDDIATISVLKGGAAAALYGSQAANGVILITTKKGSQQQGVGIEINSDANFGTPLVYPNYQYEYGQGNDGVKPATPAAALSSGRLSFGARMDGSMVLQFDGVMRPYSPFRIKDNIKNFYRPSSNITNTAAFNAGNQNVQARLSISDLRAQDQQPNSEYFRKTGNLNVRAKMGKNDFVTIESSVQYNLVEGKNRMNVGYAELNAAWPVYLAANTVDVRHMAGKDPARPGINDATGRELEWNPVPAAVNPYYVAHQLSNKDDMERLIGRASVQFNILPNLSVKGTAARDIQDYTESNYVPMTNAFTPLGYMNSRQNNSEKTNFQATVNYNDKFLNESLGMNVLFGAQRERDRFHENTANGNRWIVPNFYSITNLANLDLVNEFVTTSGTNSLFGEANLDYKSILYLTVTGRQDWFSTLNAGFNSIFYPSVGASFIVSDVVKLPKFFNYAKVRSSWAQVGSATVNAGSINQTYTINSTNNAYGLPTQSNPFELQNPNIRPITATTVEGGIDVQMLDSRLGFDINYYSRRTTDDILSPPISSATGYQAGRRNMGLITNKGLEISLNGNPIKKNDFSWDINYNFGYNENKIVELAPGIDFLSLGAGIGGPSIINAVGLPYSTVRAFVMRRDANGNLVYNKATGYEDRVLADLGVGNPPYLMGLSNNFRYKRFSLAIDIDSKFGAVGYSNLMQYATRFGLTPITLPGRENGLQVTGVDQDGAPFTKLWPVVDLDTYYNNFGSSYPGQFVYKTDFIKLRRAVLKYNLPVQTLKMLRVQSASVGITGLNLAILYRDKRVKEAGLDPEFQETVGNAQGSQGVAAPKTRNIGFNLNLRF